MDDDTFVNIPLRVKVHRVLLIIGTVLIILVLCYIALSIFLQRNVVVKAPESISVITDENVTLEAAGESWLKTYLEQHCQNFIKYTMKIVDYSIDKTEILESGTNKVLKIDFTVIPKTRFTSYFLTWGDYDKKEKTVECQWVITMTTIRHENGEIEYCCYQKQNYSQYESPNGLQDVNSYDEKKFEPITGTQINSNGSFYTIIDNKCSVSYDGGATWIEVPISVERLLDSNQDNSADNSIQEGSFIIEPKITAFFFGGTEETKLSCIYSHDGGTTWSTSLINDKIKNVRKKFCCFVNAHIGYAVISFDKNENGENQMIYKTSDGGANWKRTGSGPSTSELTDCCFFVNGQGFFCYEYVEGKRTNFFQTADDGRSFAEIPLPVNKDLDGVFNKPEAPYMEGKRYYLKIGQDERSNYLGGNVKALFVSENGGSAWKFVGIVDS